MTVKEFYEYCVERGIEDYDLRHECRGHAEYFDPRWSIEISPPIYSTGIIYIQPVDYVD